MPLAIRLKFYAGLSRLPSSRTPHSMMSGRLHKKAPAVFSAAGAVPGLISMSLLFQCLSFPRKACILALSVLKTDSALPSTSTMPLSMNMT